MPLSRAVRLIALTRVAQDHSQAAISNSFRLLRQATYPIDRPVGAHRPLEAPSVDQDN